jgi:peptidoglycan DL-endopeptidase CwlO
VAGVDRLLTRAHGLYGAGAGSGGGEVFAAGGGGGGSVPPPPDGGSGLGAGVAAAGGSYEQSQAAVSGLDADSGQTAGAGGAVADQGRAGAAVIRDQARTVAAATAPLGNSAAGARLVVAAMDEHLAAMQRQLDTTTEQNKVLAARLRQLAEAYRGTGGAGMMGAGMPMAGMSGLPMGGGPGGGGLGGLSSLAALPASLISGGAGSGGGREPGGGFLDSMLGYDGRGSEPAQRAVAFAESKLGAPYVWGAQGPTAFDCSGLVKDSYAHAGISLPRETYDMIRVGTTVDRSQIRAGDLVFSNFSGRGPEHVQLAVSPVQVIEAPTPGGHVQYSSLPHGRIVVKRVV